MQLALRGVELLSRGRAKGARLAASTPQTRASQTQDVLDGMCEKRRQGAGEDEDVGVEHTMRGPTMGKAFAAGSKWLSWEERSSQLATAAASEAADSCFAAALRAQQEPWSREAWPAGAEGSRGLAPRGQRAATRPAQRRPFHCLGPSGPRSLHRRLQGAQAADGRRAAAARADAPDGRPRRRAGRHDARLEGAGGRHHPGGRDGPAGWRPAARDQPDAARACARRGRSRALARCRCRRTASAAAGFAAASK